MTQLALQGGAPVRAQPWPRWPRFDAKEEAALFEVLGRGDWGGYPMPNLEAARFAEAFARRHDCEFGLCVANGSVSLEIAIQAMGVEPGAEVIVPAYTFEATASAMLFAGCAPVFADVRPDTYCIDPAAVEAAITPRTQAIVPVHLAMRIADMDRLGGIAEKHGLAMIEDCAHAHGARWKGKGVGSLSRAGSFSFQTSKLMTAGEGGMVITNDPGMVDGLHALTNCGRQRPDAAEAFACIGHNYRMTEFQAAILRVQLDRLDDQHALRNANIALLDDRIADIEGLSILGHDDRITTQAAYQYVFRFHSEAFGGLSREAFVAALNAEGIPCDGQFYEVVHASSLFRPDPRRYPAWEASKRDYDCPVAWRAAYEEAVWLPHPLFLGEKSDAEQIAEAIVKVCSNAGDLIGFEHPGIQSQNLSRSERARIEARRDD